MTPRQKFVEAMQSLLRWHEHEQDGDCNTHRRIRAACEAFICNGNHGEWPNMKVPCGHGKCFRDTAALLKEVFDA